MDLRTSLTHEAGFLPKETSNRCEKTDGLMLPIHRFLSPATQHYSNGQHGHHCTSRANKEQNWELSVRGPFL